MRGQNIRVIGAVQFSGGAGKRQMHAQTVYCDAAEVGTDGVPRVYLQVGTGGAELTFDQVSELRTELDRRVKEYIEDPAS